MNGEVSTLILDTNFPTEINFMHKSQKPTSYAEGDQNGTAEEGGHSGDHKYKVPVQTGQDS